MAIQAVLTIADPDVEGGRRELSSEDIPDPQVITDLLARLTSVLGSVDGLEATATALNGFVDGLETLMTALNGLVDGLEAGQASQLVELQAISGHPNMVARGNIAETVTMLDVGDKLHSILVVPTDEGQVTVTVFDDAADQAPVDFPYAEDFKGRVAPANADIVIAGDVDYYRVTYEAV